MQTAVPPRRQPIGQDGEGPVARPTQSASCPERFAPVILARTESLSVADARVLSAGWTLPRYELQRDHPGSMLSLASGSGIKRITAGVKPRRAPFSAKDPICWPGLHPPVKS